MSKVSAILLKFLVFFTLFFVSFVRLSHAESTTGLQVVQKQEQMNKGFKDESSLGSMTIINSGGTKTIRRYNFFALEENQAEGQKALIKITEPADLKGVGLLNYKHKNRDDDQWLYLPALKKTRRISGSSRSGRFLGSDFSYEDLRPKEIADYDYQLLRSETYASTSCFVIEAKSKKSDSYAKTVLWIRQDNFQTLRIDFYDKKDILSKRALFENFFKYKDKYFRAQKVIMKDLKDGGQTILEFSDIKIGIGLRDTDFSQAVLER